MALSESQSRGPVRAREPGQGAGSPLQPSVLFRAPAGWARPTRPAAMHFLWTHGPTPSRAITHTQITFHLT